MDSRLVGWGLVVAGIVVAVASAFLLVTSAGGGAAAASPSPVAAAPTAASSPAPTPAPAAPTITATATPAATPAATTTPEPTATPEPTLDADAIRAFVARLVGALRDGDATFQVARLHPATLARYGEEQCLTELPTRKDDTVAITIRSIGSPETWGYTTDGLTTTIDGAVPVDADVVVQGASSRQTLHFAFAGDGTVLWFTDCGTPAPAGSVP